MTPTTQKEYIITEDGMNELDKYFIEHKDGLIKIAWKNFKDKHVCSAKESSDKVLECRDIVFNRVVYGKCPYNGDCGQCFLCDNAGGCIVHTDAELRTKEREG